MKHSAEVLYTLTETGFICFQPLYGGFLNVASEEIRCVALAILKDVLSIMLSAAVLEAATARLQSSIQNNVSIAGAQVRT